MELSFDDIKEMILNNYYETTGLKRVDLNIELVENIYQRRLELESCEETRKTIQDDKDFIENYNGTIVLPKALMEFIQLSFPINL